MSDDSTDDEQEQYGGGQGDIDAVDQTERRTEDGGDEAESGDGEDENDDDGDVPDDEEWIEREHESPDDAEEG